MANLNGLPLSRSYFRFSASRTFFSACSFYLLSSFCKSSNKLLKQAFIFSVARSQPLITPQVLRVRVRVSLLRLVSTSGLDAARAASAAFSYFLASGSTTRASLPWVSNLTLVATLWLDERVNPPPASLVLS